MINDCTYTKKAKIVAQKFLYKKKLEHSKLDFLEFKELKCAEYLLDQSISKNEVKLLFKLRTRMYSVKNNFKIQYNNNLTCDLCKSQKCDQPHLLQCSVLKKSTPELNFNTTVKYNDIFGDIDKIVPAIKLLSKIVKKREELLEAIQ